MVDVDVGVLGEVIEPSSLSAVEAELDGEAFDAPGGAV
jgi:hypothetical protein